jgi:HK97 family phage prohead protease
MREYMTVPVEWKAAAGGDAGELEGYASVFGNVDRGGDVVLPGAFKKTLADWSRAAQPMPLIADHDLSTEGVIGSVRQAREDRIGLWVKAGFSSDPKAQSVRTKMVEGHLKGMSFTYETVRHYMGQVAGKSARFLQELRLFEATVTPFPMNDLAVASAKAAMTSASINDLPDSAFAYIEPGGKKDAEGKTTPRSLRHFPVHDEAHARNALARAPQSPFGKQAMPAILAACRKFGIKVSDESESASLDFDGFAEGMRSALAIPFEAASKAAADLLIAAYHLSDIAAGTADGPDPTADGTAVSTPPGAAGTPDDAGRTPAEYADQVMNRGTADGSPASLDQLEARIRNSLGEAS